MHGTAYTKCKNLQPAMNVVDEYNGFGIYRSDDEIYGTSNENE